MSTTYIKCGGGGLPPQVVTDMNAVLNKKFKTSTTYPTSTWAGLIEDMTECPIKSASGTIATFPDGADTVPLKSLTLTVTPSQSGTGDPSPTNPRPLNSFSSLAVVQTGANMLDGTRAKNYAVDTFSTSEAGTNTTGNYYTLQAGNPINNQTLFPWLKFNASTQYTLIFKIGKNNNATSTNIRVVYTDGTGENLTRTSTSTDPETTETLVFTTNANKSVKEVVGYYQSGKTYLYYANIGIFEGVLTAQDFTAYTGDTHTLDLGQTCYGVTGDAVTGKFEGTHGVVDLGSLSWTYHAASGQYSEFFDCYLPSDSIQGTSSVAFDGYCSIYKSIKSGNIATTGYDNNVMALAQGSRRFIVCDQRYHTKEDFKTAMSGILLCYPLATPTELTTDPVEVDSFEGVNNLWCTEDNSTVAVEYRADPNII